MDKINILDLKWQQELKNFRYNIKFDTEKKKHDYWNNEAEAYDERMLQDNRRVEAVRNVLKQNNVLNRNSRVIEIGCGTGLYSIDLSHFCKSVTAVDLSEKMGEVLLNKVYEKNIKNIDFKCLNWADADIKALNMYKAFDIAVSALNPSLNSFSSLKKFCDLSNKSCCVVTFSGNIQNSVSRYLEDLKFLNLQKRNDGIWTKYIVDILKELGYKPQLCFTQMKWIKQNTEKEAIERLEKEYEFILKNLDSKKIINELVHNNLDANGVFKEYNVSPLSVIYWEV